MFGTRWYFVNNFVDNSGDTRVLKFFFYSDKRRETCLECRIVVVCEGKVERFCNQLREWVKFDEWWRGLGNGT